MKTSCGVKRMFSFHLHIKTTAMANADWRELQIFDNVKIGGWGNIFPQKANNT